MYLVPFTEDIEHPALIEELMQNLDATAYENNIHKYENLQSMKKKIDHNYKKECWPKIIMKSLNELTFLDIMDLTSDRIDNYKNLILSLLKLFTMFKITCWKNKKE